MNDYATIEALASRLCHDAGGNWEAKYTKRNHWRKKAEAQLVYQWRLKVLYEQNITWIDRLRHWFWRAFA